MRGNYFGGQLSWLPLAGEFREHLLRLAGLVTWRQPLMTPQFVLFCSPRFPGG